VDDFIYPSSGNSNQEFGFTYVQSQIEYKDTNSLELKQASRCPQKGLQPTMITFINSIEVVVFNHHI